MVKVTLYCETKNESIELVIASVVTVGRGFFECQDKRVSRAHGVITVAEAHISIKSCHTNPIFYKRKGQQESKVLSKDMEVTLKHQDRFSLLPNELEYEVRVLNDENGAATVPDSSSSVSQAAEQQSAFGTADATISQADDREHSAGSSSDSRKRTHQPELHVIAPKRKKSTSDPDEIPAFTVTIKPDPDEALTTSEQSAPVATIVKIEPLSQPDASSSTNPSASISSTVPDAKVKTEPTQTAPVAQPALRPSCNFGIRCYQNTPDHRRDYAHPSDFDYRRPDYPSPPDSTPPCPFAASCYRRNPDHFQRLSHPPASQFVAQQQPPVAVNYVPVAINVNYAPLNPDDEDESVDDIYESSDSDSLEDEDYEVVVSEESGIDEAADSDNPDNCEE